MIPSIATHVRATGHERGAVASTLLASRHTRSDEKEALGFQLMRAANGVGVVRVSTVDDNVTLLEVGSQLLDKGVHGGAGLDEEDHLARALELGNKLLNRVCAHDICA